MKRIRFLPTVYLTFALLASVLLLSQIQSQKNLSTQKGLQDVTKVSAKDAPPEPEYAPGEIIVKFKHPITGIKDKNNKDISSEFDKHALFYSDLKETSIPSDVQDIHKKFSISKIEKVFKGAQFPVEELKKFKNNFPKRTINEQKLLNTNLNSTYKISYDSGESPNTVATALETNPNIEYAEPNYIIHPAVVPNDVGFVFLWNLHNNGERCPYEDVDIDAPEAWDIETGSDSVIVAVIDTGVDYNHEDLSENIWINAGEIPNNGIDDDNNGYTDDIHGWNFSNNNNNPFDNDSHGTHVSGIIGAVGNNTIGVVGVNWRVKIMPLKIFGSGSGGTTSLAASAIHYANIMGARVSNNSWGGYGGYSQTLYDAINEANAYDAIFVAGAGNGRGGIGVDIDNDPFYPASYDLPNIISVAASDCMDSLAEFSNYGVHSVDIVAPGVAIMSTTPNNSYEQYSGTSMATPHVAGAVALLFSKFPSVPSYNIRYKILNNIDSMLRPVTGKIASGGRLNLYKAIIDTTTYPTPTPPNTPTPTSPPPTPVPMHWYSFTPEVIPNSDWNSAEEVLDKLTLMSGILARQINMHNGSGWVGHINNLPFNNFPIEINKGYQIDFASPINPILYSQLTGLGDITSSTYTMVGQQYNLIGIAHNLLQSNSIMNSEELCSKFGLANTSDTLIRYWDPETQNWTEHQCQTSINNFEIDSYGNAFFIYTNSDFSFTLQELTPSATPTITPTPPLSVFLDSFTAQWVNNRNTWQVRADWVTTSEINNTGFNIWRGTTPKGPTVKLNKTIIPSCSPGGTQGCSYSFTDVIPLSGGRTRPTYYYWLEDIDLNGTVTRHGPVGTDGSGGP